MPVNVFLALLVFSAVMAFTPGPNNIMLAASGVNFGLAPTIPHMAGVTIGFAVLLTVCATGLGLILATAPSAQLALKIAGALYMLWLAYKVASANASADEDARPARPFTFFPGRGIPVDKPEGGDRRLQCGRGLRASGA
jgi:threonine/homoserine/homoserine lactone efflux protein